MNTERTAGLRRIARLTDDVFRIPGTNFRFGLDPLIGLVPVGGDVAGGLISAYTLVTAYRLGAAPAVIARMAGNILLDVVGGAVPVLGDLFDAGWKANRRNVALLEQYVAAPAPVSQRSRLVMAVAVVAVLLAFAAAAVLSIAILRWLFAQF